MRHSASCERKAISPAWPASISIEILKYVPGVYPNPTPGLMRAIFLKDNLFGGHESQKAWLLQLQVGASDGECSQ